MDWGSIERELDSFWQSLSEAEREKIRETGIDWEDADTSTLVKLAALKTTSDTLKDQAEWSREKALRYDLLNQTLDKMEKVQRETTQMQVDAYREIEGERTRVTAETTREMLGAFYDLFEKARAQGGYEAVEEPKQLPAGEPKAIQGALPVTANCVVGGETLPNCVFTYQKDDGEFYQRCLVAYYAHTRNMIPLQIVSEDKLRQSGCPLFKSREISRQIPGVRWLFKKSICKLADGQEHRLGEYRTSIMEGR